jgi:hypothetical protein
MHKLQLAVNLVGGPLHDKSNYTPYKMLMAPT